MTEDELAFIRAATADPADDTCRLVYADWLEEQGGEAFAAQAAFVRLQVARARLDLFDPARVPLLLRETDLVRRHRRAWNGRVHQHLARRGLGGRVAARRGVIRSWDHHRGLIDRVTLDATACAAHVERALSLGPVQCLAVAGWYRPIDALFVALGRVLPRMRAFSLIGQALTLIEELPRIEGLGLVPLLDLQSIECGHVADRLAALAREGRISPVVLFRRNVVTAVRHTVGRRAYVGNESRSELHAIDPFGHWAELRRWYSDLCGTVLAPVPYRPARR
jgi:uncharacterized protein (TIGR02996 family)